MANSPIFEWSQEDRVPQSFGVETKFFSSDTGWVHWFDPGFWVQTLRLDGVPHIDPANVLGDEGKEISITISADFSFHWANAGMDVYLFTSSYPNLILAQGLWTFNHPSAPGSNCPGTVNPDVWTVRFSARDFYNVREEYWAHNPDMIPRLYFLIALVGQDWGLRCPHHYVKVELSFSYTVQEPFPADLKLWDEDLCQNMVMTPTYKPGEWFPHLLSTHPTRVMAQVPSATAEVCRHHPAEIVIDHDGFARAFYCGKSRVTNDPNDQRNYYAEPYIVQEKDTVLRSQVPAGMACFLGSYHAPKWTEAQLWSHRAMCEGVL